MLAALRRSGRLARVLFHVQTLWLFTSSDAKTILIPSTIFGIVNATLLSCYGMPTSVPDHGSYIASPAIRWLLAFSWVWLNLLPFNINNQISEAAIAEDTVNKPWRPMPSKRMPRQHAKITMTFAYLLAQIWSACVGGLRQGLSLVVLGVWYNNLGGGDRNPLVRNIINALGYVSFLSGAMEVALGTSLDASPRLAWWFGMIAGVIATTVHSQDLSDQQGDRSRGRRTVPLVIGDLPSRGVLAFWMFVWGVLGPHFWSVHIAVRLTGVALAAVVGYRSLAYRGPSSDEKTFLVWNAWICLTFLLPIWSQA